MDILNLLSGSLQQALGPTAVVYALAAIDKTRLFGPVKVNDTIQVEIEVLDTKAVPARGGGIVRYRHWVKNQLGETIMEYDVARLIRGNQSGVRSKE